MMEIAVLGSGSWGTALAMLLHNNGHHVTLWARTEKHAETMRQTSQNPRLTGVTLPTGLTYTSELSCAAGKRLVVLATPSFAIRETARAVAPYLAADAVPVCVAKGIEAGTSLRLSQVIKEETGKTAVVLSGPSHAEEVARGLPTGCVAACKDPTLALLVQDAFMSEKFRVYASDDPIGVELGGALKNIMALCAGVSDGMGLGDNTRALMMTRGLTELARLCMALGGRRETIAGLSGVGDLIVTCTSQHSRNRRAGILIGQGRTPEQAMQEVGAVVEGYYAAASARELAQKAGVEMPITEQVYAVLYEGRDPRTVPTALMTRDRKNEFEDAAWQ
jgi:glycerol-3-phosphate dehydrogenase (NAD(P)+)